MTHSYMWHDSFIHVAWLIHMCDMTHSYMWHDVFTRVTCLMHVCDMTHSYARHDSSIRVTWLLHTRDMTQHTFHVWIISSHMYEWVMSHVWMKHITHMTESCLTATSYVRMSHVPRPTLLQHTPLSYVWHDAFTFKCVTWCIQMRALDALISHLNTSCHTSHGTHMNESLHTYDSHLQMRALDALICVQWLIHMRAMTRLYVCNDSFICVQGLVNVCAVTYSYVCNDSFICVPSLVNMCATTYS